MSDDARRFPVLKPTVGGPRESIPWKALEPHARQAIRNHSQTLEQLAERGGLAWSEMFYILRNEPFPMKRHPFTSNEEAKPLVLAMLKERGFEA